ncbi:pyridoxal phosphate-dependent aminotransferase [Aureispira anguillae]|uniref:Histidinol-phosphate aminotransferase family protein n=1 Tax=Aureispira anguillae TaxID=2864201 RepID=A0A915YKB5_9BACT|nr:histidinol-phosphate aminotransferase family protein [Aureispira anguillae]BDS14599.1 histidinol-phosphate aminotransferase family protein [Aureispira anguillae]
MEHTENIQHLLPRHIRKLVESKEALTTGYPNKEGYLNAHSAVGLYGTIGTDDDYSQRPDSQALKLKEELAAYAMVDANQICIGNGSTELIDLVLRAFCVPNQDRILTFSPANNRIEHFAKMQALEVLSLNLGHDFELPIYEVRKALEEEPKMIVIENPNHITGSCVASFDLVDLATNFDGIVVIDESAIDYVSEQSLLTIIKDCSNVIIIQSFSRAWGLAALPVGIAYADPEIIKVLNAIKPAYSVNEMAQRMATKALYVADQKDRIVSRTIEERQQVKETLEKLPAIVNVYDSNTNTLLIEVEDATLMTEHLRKEEQIYVLNVSNYPGLENCIRITIGKGIDNLRLVKAFKDMPSKTSGSRFFWQTVSKTLRQASSFLGVFKKILGV